MKHSVVATFLLCSSSLISPAFSVLDADEVVDLSAPFVKTGKSHLSPVEGADLSLMKGLRFQGRYSANKSGFPVVEHNQLRADDLPQDEVAALIQRLFPSPTHDTLAANNLIHDHLRKWLTPESTARLLSFIEDHNTYQRLSDEERLIGIMEALSSQFQARMRALKKQRPKGISLDDKRHLLQKFTNHDTYAFATLLNTAILTSRDPNHPNEKFYPPRAVERALLVYMDLQVPGKKALQPYYDAMAEELVDKSAAPNLASKRTKDDYLTLKNDLKSGKLPLEDFLNNPEHMLFLHLGFSLYEDRLPPDADYCTVSYKDPDGKIFRFSNCGEATLLCTFNAGLFNRVTREFDISHLAKLKDQGLISPHEGLFSFFENVQNTPAKVGNSLTQSQFAQLISNLNTPDTKDPIRYRKEKGKVQKKGRNGIYEIDSGLDNFLRVIGRLLGVPSWAPLQGDNAEIAQAAAHNLNLFCQLMTRDHFSLSWQNSETKDQTIKDLRGSHLSFLINDVEVFKLDFGLGHFQFERVSEKGAAELFEIGKQILKAEKPWHPFFAFYIRSFTSILEHQFSSPEALANYIKGYFYSSDLESLKGRTKALKAMVTFKRDFKSDMFDYLLSRWLTPEGRYFDEWQDQYTTLKVLNTLSSVMSLNDILALDIKPFTGFLSRDNLVSTFEIAIDDDLSHLGRLLLSQKGALETLAFQTFTYPDSSDEEDENDDEEEFEEDSNEGSDLENDLVHEASDHEVDTDISNDERDMEVNPTHENQPIPENRDEENEDREQEPLKFSLLHGLAKLNLSEFMEEAVNLGADVNATDTHKTTPLHDAATTGKLEGIKKLLTLGANPNLKDSDDNTPFGRALSNTYEFMEDTFSSEHINQLLELLLDSNINFEDVRDIFSLFLSNGITNNDFEKLIEKFPLASFDYAPVFWEVVSVGDLEKFHLLRKNGINLTEMMKSIQWRNKEGSPHKPQIVRELLEMGADLNSLANTLSHVLDAPSFEKFVQEFPPERTDELSVLTSGVSSSGDIDKLRALRQKGVKWNPDPSALFYLNTTALSSSEKRLEWYQEVLEMGGSLELVFPRIVNDLDLISFEKFVKDLPPACKAELTSMLPYVTNVKHLDKLQVLRKEGVTCDPKHTPFLNLTDSDDEKQLAVVQELLAMGADLKNLSTIMLIALTPELFEKFVEDFPSERTDELTVLLSGASRMGDLDKLRALRQKGVKCDPDPSAVFSFTLTALSNSEKRVEWYQEVLEIGMSLGLVFSHIVDVLDLASFERFVKELPPTRKTELTSMLSCVANVEHLDKLQVLRKEGVTCDPKQIPSLNLTDSDDVKQVAVVQELLAMGADLKNFSYALVNNLNPELFEKFVQSFPPERTDELSVLISDVSSHGDLDKLRSLRQKGVKCSPAASIMFSNIEKRVEWYQEVLEMGTPLGSIFLHIVNVLDLASFEKFVKELPPAHKAQLTSMVSAVATMRHLDKLQVLRKEGVTCDPKQIPSLNLTDSDDVKQVAVVQELLAMGADLKNFSYDLVNNLNPELFEKFVQNFPSERREELVLLVESALSFLKIDKLCILRKLGIKGNPEKEYLLYGYDFQKQLEAIQELLEMGINLKKLSACILHLNSEAFRKFIQDFPVERRGELAELIAYRTLLEKQNEKLHILREEGVTLHHLDDKGYSLLFLAFCNNDFDTMEELVKMGANLNGDTQNKNLLYSALGEKDTLRLKALLKLGANVKVINESGQTPLMLVAYGGDIEEEKAALLIAAGADPDEKVPFFGSIRSFRETTAPQKMKRIEELVASLSKAQPSSSKKE